MQHKLADFREQSRSSRPHVDRSGGGRPPRTAKDDSAMKISCQSCQAKYTIADEKVLGKIVKIRCKKCSATIVINGNETAAAAMPAGGDPNVFDYTAQSGGGEQWTVNVADGDQRTLSSAEIADAY